MQVSVIVATYHPDNRKLLATLCSIVSQKDITFEIIITDDGSSSKDFSWLSQYFDAHSITQYTILEHPQNMGTIRNLIAGLSVASGEYAYTISPGDLLFDHHVLRDFYHFAKSNNSECCFGNAIYYTFQNDVPALTRKYGVPMRPKLFQLSPTLGKLNFFCGDAINGAAYFRKREFMLNYFKKISSSCRYLEDAASSVYALSENKHFHYYSRNVVWYEDGTGISTNNSSKWAKILHQEYQSTLLKLKTQYPKDALIDTALINLSIPDRKKRLLTKLVKHPSVFLTDLFFKALIKPTKQSVSTAELSDLKEILTKEFHLCK